MKRKLLTLVLLAACWLSAFGQAIDKIVATVRLTVPQTITVKQLRMLVDPLELQNKRSLTKEERLNALNGLVNRALIEQAAERDKVTVSDAEVKTLLDQQKKALGAQYGRELTDAELQSVVKSQGQDYDYWVKQLKYTLLMQKWALFLNKDLAATPTVADGEARTYYDENKSKFFQDDILHLKWIIIDTRDLSKDQRDQAAKTAEDALKELRAGAKIEDLARKYSDDPNSKYNGGDAGWVIRNDATTRDRFGADFFKAIFAMKKGDTSGVLTTNVGIAIVQVIERYSATLLGFDDVVPQSGTTVKDTIKTALAAQKKNDAFVKTLEAKIAELKKTADIKIFEENLAW
jgi:parvulin-like peptidyl-prolyl isomerase